MSVLTEFRTFRRFCSYLSRQDKTSISLHYFASLLLSLSESAFLYYFYRILPKGSIESHSSAVTDQSPLLVSVIGLLALVFILRILTILFNAFLSARFSSKLTVKCFSNLIHLPYEDQLAASTSESISLLSQITSGISVYFLSFNQILSASLTSLFLVCVLLSIQPTLTLLSLLVVVSLYLLISAVTDSLVNNISRTKVHLTSDLYKLQLQTLGGLREIAFEQTQHLFVSRLNLAISPLQQLNTRQEAIASLPRPLLEFFLYSIIVIFITASSASSALSVLPFSILITFSLGALRLLPMVQQTYASITLLKLNRELGLRALYLLQSPRRPTAHAVDHVAISLTPTIVQASPTSLVLNHISYSYPSGPQIINNISLTVKPGEKLGIVGTSGSGKTTLVNILLGLLTPHTGSISYICAGSEEPLHHPNKIISYVPQDIYIDDSTLADNICFPLKYHDTMHSRIQNALERSNLSSFTAQNARGIYHETGEGGKSLSGGQKQRLGIARALFHNRPILILDEATSALDTNTQTLINKALFESNPHLTIISITHRYETLQYCDRVLKLSSGDLSDVTSLFS